MKEKAKKLIEKYEELESELGNPDVLGDQARYNKIHKQYKGIEKAVLKAKEYLQMMDDLEEYKIALGDSDPEMVAMAKAEISEIEKKLPEVTDELQILMVPKDPWDFRNATLEIRGGTGGDESALFAGDLFRMYRGYCDKMGWKMTGLERRHGGRLQGNPRVHRRRQRLWNAQVRKWRSPRAARAGNGNTGTRAYVCCDGGNSPGS